MAILKTNQHIENIEIILFDMKEIVINYILVMGTLSVYTKIVKC